MATDLRKARTTRVEETRQGQRGSTKHSRWPYVATAIVLAVLATVTVLILTQEAPRPSTSTEQWRGNVEGTMTDIREGSGFSQPAEIVPTRVDAGTYAEGALTGSREGSASEPATDVLPDLMTEVREG